MKILIMMRSMDQDSGFRSITENYIDNMLKLDSINNYLLLYRKSKWFGRFKDYENVKEILKENSSKIFWDQFIVPYTAWKEKADVIFNPKFTVPLISSCPVTMGLQEPAWWTWPQHYEWLNVRYERLMLPIYIQKAKYIFPNSNFILEENRKVLGISLTNTSITYSASPKVFHLIEDKKILSDYRKEAGLPEKIIVNITRVDHPGIEGSTSFHEGKNPETVLKAFLQISQDIPHKLIFAGRRVKEYMLFKGFNEENFENVIFLGFIPQENLNKLYNLADVAVIPSLYEGCPANVMDPMAAGCPVIASSTGGCPDIGSDAVVYADPYKSEDFAEKMKLVLNDSQLRFEMRKKGLERSKFFSWEKSARTILDGLTKVVSESGKA